jgi:hypothetical protein
MKKIIERGEGRKKGFRSQYPAEEVNKLIAS